MEEFKRETIILFVIVLIMGSVISSGEAYKFFVGGKDGWVLKPSEGYNHWAERMRFQVNDTLYFKFKKGLDSVLVVTKEDYYSCNNKKPIQSLTDGDDSVFTFNRSGPYFFISGYPDNCNQGQKLIVIVMAVRNKTHHHESPASPSPSPSPVSSPPPESSHPPSASPPSVSPPVQPPKTSAPPPAVQQPPMSAPPTPVQPPVQPPKSGPHPVKPPKSAQPPVQSPKSAPPLMQPPPESAPVPVQPPERSGRTPSNTQAPAPAPANSGSSSLGWNGGSVLGFSVGVILVFGSFMGLV